MADDDNDYTKYILGKSKRERDENGVKDRKEGDFFNKNELKDNSHLANASLGQ